MSDTITSANASIYLTFEDLYPAGFRAENFSTDLSVSTDDVTLAEVRMGVDGHLAMGYTPAPITFTLALEANSPTRDKLDNVAAATRVNQRIYVCDAQVTIPGIGKTYSYRGGCMLVGHLMPDLKKTLDPTQWKFTFESMEVSRI